MLLISGLSVAKCSKYWPHLQETQMFGAISVTTISKMQVSNVPGLTKRCIQVQVGNSEHSKQVIQYQYTGWPDFGIPSSPQPLVEMTKIMREELLSKGGVGLIHCSAGVGRTGTMLALNKIMEDIDAGSEKVDIFNTVLNLRSERVLMVQKLLQYEFLYASTDYYLRTKESTEEKIESYYVYSNTNFDENEIEY